MLVSLSNAIMLSPQQQWGVAAWPSSGGRCGAITCSNRGSNSFPLGLTLRCWKRRAYAAAKGPWEDPDDGSDDSDYEEEEETRMTWIIEVIGRLMVMIRLLAMPTPCLSIFDCISFKQSFLFFTREDLMCGDKFVLVYVDSQVSLPKLWSTSVTKLCLVRTQQVHRERGSFRSRRNFDERECQNGRQIWQGDSTIK